MSVSIWLVLVVCVAMPLGYAWSVWRLDENSRGGWLVATAYAAVIVVIVLMVGRWDIAGYYTYYVLAALFAAAVLLSWRRHADRPWWPSSGGALPSTRWFTLLLLVLFGAGAIYVAAGLLPTGEVRSLAFPLKDGWFMVGQGGRNVLLNHHHNHTSQRYAVDIVALNDAGFRASGVYPDELADYAAYDAAVVSPCNGTVTEVRDGLPDLDPPETDADNPAGNHIVIACGDMLVMLAHLRPNSITVDVGETLFVGQSVAKVGNTGNTTEPHLHIHAVGAQSGDISTGEGVPIAFDGRFPVRNDTFRR